MQLFTGGFGFIGAHTVRALLDLGQHCVLTQHRSNRIPDFIKQDITWLHEDTGHEPQFSVDAGIANYVTWLRAGDAE